VIAPADPVEALAKVLKSVRVDGMPIVITWSDAEDLARAALAHARALVPPESMSIEVRYREAWNNCRAETLRRLGGK